MNKKHLIQEVLNENLPIYLDYAASTPVDPRVAQKMSECLLSNSTFGNPSSTHWFGKKANELIENAREEVARFIGTVPRDLIFTSGATEANNLAIRGVAHYYRHKGNHLITCKTEHKAVLDVYRALEEEGFLVTYLDPLPSGLIDLEQLEEAIRKDTLLVSLMHVNNETGVVQDIQKAGEITRSKGVFLHVDAAQSLGKLSINLAELPVDLMSFAAHKIYGPKGVGGLYIASHPSVRLVSEIVGGAQERKLRAGTLATHQIVGFGEACRLIASGLTESLVDIKKLRDRFWAGICDLPGVYLNVNEAYSLPNFLNVRFLGKTDHAKADIFFEGLAVSSASACNSVTLEPSYVLRAMGYNETEAKRSIRFSFGRFTTEAEIDKSINLVKEGYLNGE